VDNDVTSPNTLIGGGTVSKLVQTLASKDYFDVAASYKVTKNITLSAAVNNLLDTDPPVRNNGAGFTNGNTYPVVYDALGRRVSLTLNAKF
jgi:outer membrane receptor protein involved in Fe transport